VCLNHPQYSFWGGAEDRINTPIVMEMVHFGAQFDICVSLKGVW